MTRLFFLAGALMAAISVGMGAYGAHTDMFDEVQSLWVEKAARYQMYHALALILTALALSNKRTFQPQMVLAGWCFLGGIVLFSGSLYLMAFLTIDIGFVTPIGGLLFMVGWILMALAGTGSTKTRK
jgi:uncharacterized membrane protein YgdD (TMEM256/DUF423 family)